MRKRCSVLILAMGVFLATICFSTAQENKEIVVGMTCTYRAMGIDRIFLGIDYPYEQIDESIQFLNSLPLSEEEKDKLYYLNAKPDRY